MKLGVLTRNFPPMHGGMARHAFGIVEAISNHMEVELFVPECESADDRPYKIHASLDKNVTRNKNILDSTQVDAWLGLSASFAPLATYSDRPFVLYFHGNDFLNPVFDPSDSLESRLGRVPLVWRVSQQLAAPFRVATAKRRKKLLNRSLRDTSLILFNSTFTRDLARRLYDCAPARLEVLHPGCDDFFFQEPEERLSGPMRLLTVSNLAGSNKRKNIDGVLEAIVLLNGDPPVQYTVIGNGDDLPRLESRAHALGIHHLVNFRGNVTDEDLLAAYRSHDVMVLASKASDVDVEGFGMVYIEANAAGLPVLASAKGGAIDAIIDGRTGLLIPDSTSAAIAGGLRRFYVNATTFDKNEMQAHAERFRWSRIGNQLDALLRSVV